jgi:hypothetical protein
MSGDPNECRANASRCIELAAQVKYPELKETFLELAKRWTELATKLEKARLGKARARPKKPKGKLKGKLKGTPKRTPKKARKRALRRTPKARSKRKSNLR